MSTSVATFAVARRITLPPRPPSPPSGPPFGRYFSRRKLTQPSPPRPAFTKMSVLSTNTRFASLSRDLRKRATRAASNDVITRFARRSRPALRASRLRKSGLPAGPDPRRVDVHALVFLVRDDAV